MKHFENNILDGQSTVDAINDLNELSGAVSVNALMVAEGEREPSKTDAGAWWSLIALAEAALSAARKAGAEYADLRVHRLLTQSIRLRDGRVESLTDATELGLAVRVLVDGTWGFASHAGLTPQTACEVARRAVGVATTLRALNRERVERKYLTEVDADRNFGRSRLRRGLFRRIFADSSKVRIRAETHGIV